MLNFSLSPEQLEVQKRAREFALNELLPVAWYFDEKNETPLFVLEKAFDAGLMNTDIPATYGGKGYGMLEGILLTEEIAAVCSGFATSIFDNSLGLEPLILSDNESLKQAFLPTFAKEFKLVCFATSEPTMGSDVSGIRCEAKPEGNDYILNGTKYWITNGGIADYISVFATVDPKSQHEGICAFLVDMNSDGVIRGEHIPKLGQRTSNTTGVNFNNVRVPKEHVLAPPGEGFVLAMKTFSRTRPAVGSLAIGAARSAMEFAIDYAKKRRVFGTKISNYQAIQFKIAEMYQKIETARLLIWKAAWESDSGMDPTISASMAKFYSTEAALEIVNDALQVFGGYGYTKLFPLEKLLRDTRLFTIYEGTSEIQRLIVSGHAMHAYRPVMPPLEDLPMLKDMGSDDMSPPGKETTAWRCRMCGHVHHGDTPPDHCPYCFFPKSTFKKVWPEASDG
jgi:acyl-CoA dehydrogenase